MSSDLSPEMKTLVDQLKVHEGFRPKAYLDSEGYPTIGYGRLLEHKKYTNEEFRKSKWVKETATEEGERSFLVAKAQKCLDYTHSKGYTGNDALVVADMCYQMGQEGVDGFVKMHTALRNGDKGTAAYEIANSKFARQTPGRALDHIELLLKDSNVTFTQENVVTNLPATLRANVESVTNLKPETKAKLEQRVENFCTVLTVLSSLPPAVDPPLFSQPNALPSVMQSVLTRTAGNDTLSVIQSLLPQGSLPPQLSNLDTHPGDTLSDVFHQAAGISVSMIRSTNSSDPISLIASSVAPSIVAPSIVAPSIVAPSIVAPSIVASSIVAPSIVAPSI
eukprot:PhF_6_TR5763/c1_g2_i4/m.8501